MEISRKDLKEKLTKLGYPAFTIKKVSFQDMARDYAYKLKVERLPIGVISAEYRNQHLDGYKFLESLRESKPTYQGKRLLIG